MVTDLAWPAYVHVLWQIATEHEFYKSPDFSGERSVTRILVRSHDAPSSGYRVVEGQPINLHIHTGDGQTVCIEITTER